jgi:hypothetical protein
MSYQQNPLVPWLLSHAYGQGGTVAVPSADIAAVSMPRSDFPPGIQDVLNYVKERYLAWSPAGNQAIDWCFLVGGPGNGKSEALRVLATTLGVPLPGRNPGRPVPRVVPAEWPDKAYSLKSGLSVAFINDASIPRADEINGNEPGSLFKDLRDAVDRLLANRQPVALFGNVNRGILVEEASCLSDGHKSLATPSGKFASSIIRWLVDPPASLPPDSPSSLPPASHGIETVVPIDPLAPQYGQFRVHLVDEGAAQDLVVHVIFLDVLSLLEPQPGWGRQVVDFSQSVPRVAPYHTLGNLISVEAPRDRTTAGKLVQAFVEPTRWASGGCQDPMTGTLCAAFAMCPFAQNSRWLQADALRHRFLDALRAAEVAAGRRFAYRDLLGHVSLAILGQPEEPWLEGTHPCKWSAQQYQEVQNSSKKAAVKLISHRLYSSLFHAPGSEPGWRRLADERGQDTVYGAVKVLLQATGESPRPQPFERAFQDIDPARDTEPWGRVRTRVLGTRVLEAVESLDIVAPSAEAAGWNDVPGKAHSEVENILDKVLREEIATELERGSREAALRVRILRRWRSTLLLRQIGTALGHLGFGATIQAWLAEQENALRNGQHLRLGDGIRNLIIPSDRDGRVFLPPLRPRTYCIAGELPKNSLLVPVTVHDLNVVIVPRGDTLTAEVQINRARQRKPPLVLASLVVDLAVAREAMLHADGNTSSFTEIGDTAFARIERARASLISRARIKDIPVYFTDDLGQLFKLAPNPVSPVPLRVQRA